MIIYSMLVGDVLYSGDDTACCVGLLWYSVLVGDVLYSGYSVLCWVVVIQRAVLSGGDITDILLNIRSPLPPPRSACSACV